ncbi:hypothetical protein BU17DRAFT_72352 [Hysterangium stoloniferum]|nr:hypothetical protein BU17DRAFT_72352 [Hysterangium stoloniferum]
MFNLGKSDKSNISHVQRLQLQQGIMSNRSRITRGKIDCGCNQGVIEVQLGRHRRDIADESVSGVKKGMIRPSQLLEEHQKVTDFRQAELAKLPPETARSMQSMHSTAPHSGNDNSDADGSYVADGNVWVDIPNDGEFTLHELQGLELSYEGGELESLVADWKNVAKSHCRHKQVPGNIAHWQMQASKCRKDWDIQLPLLYEAYMEFKYGSDATQADISDAGNIAGGIQMEQGLDKFTIAVLGLQGYNAVCSLAHNKCPQFSLQQWVKVICDLSNLADEPTLSPSVIGAMDGNNSLKCFNNKAQTQDTLTFESDYFLSWNFVNGFARDVRVIRKRRKGNDIKEVCEEGDPTDGDPAIVTGVFIAACRHGIIWIISDMVKSGELAKYPLAACAYILELLPSDLGIGTTLANSSLGMCQGFGLEDCEVCERVFSGSNKVARCTRHSTMYHRRQFIDMYFCQWDSDKYENLATLLLSNYQQALETIDEMTMCQTILTAAEREIPHTQFMEWLNEERVYLTSKASEPKEDISCIEYVELLQKYDTARMLAEQARKIESDTTTCAKDATHMCCSGGLGGCPYTAEGDMYKAVLKYMDKQVFQLAVDKLEGLVVQHIFELTKANVSETGYKLRNQIAKAIKTRSKAI